MMHTPVRITMRTYVRIFIHTTDSKLRNVRKARVGYMHADHSTTYARHA